MGSGLPQKPNKLHNTKAFVGLKIDYLRGRNGKHGVPLRWESRSKSRGACRSKLLRKTKRLCLTTAKPVVVCVCRIKVT